MTSNTTMPGTVQIDNGIIRLNTPRNLDWDYTHEAKWYNIFPTKLHQPAWRYMSSGTGRRVNPSPVATESWGGNTDPAYPTAVSGVGTRFTDGESRLLFEAGFKGETDGGGERHLVYGTTFVPGDKLKWVHPRPYEEPEVLTSAVKRALETFQASSRLCDTVFKNDADHLERVGQYLEGRLGQALTEACKGQDIQVVRVVPDDYSRLGLVKGHRICTIREHGHHCGHVWVGDEASKRTAPSYFRQLHVPGDPADTLSDDPNVWSPIVLFDIATGNDPITSSFHLPPTTEGIDVTPKLFAQMFSDDWARGPGKVPRRHWNETIASAKAAFWEYSARLQRLRSGQDPLVHDPDQATRDRGLSSKSAYPCTDTLGIRRALQAFIKTALHREMGTLFNKLTQDMHGEVPRGLLRPKISDSTRLDWRQRQDLRRTGMLNSDSLSCLLPDPPTFQLILQTIDKSVSDAERRAVENSQLPTYDAVQSEPVQRVVLAAANTPNDPPPPYSEASAAPPQQQSTRQHQQETSSGSDGDDNEQWFDSMEGMSM